MPFDPNVPLPTDIRSSSQADLLDNFSSVATQWAVNHIPLTTGGATAGYHTEIFFSGGSATAPGLSPPHASLYSMLFNSIPQLFFQNGTTSSTQSQLTGANSPARGSYITPWGLTINSGSTLLQPNRANTITFAQPFSAGPYTIIMSPNVTPQGPSPNWSITSSSATSFVARAASNRSFNPAVGMFYFAIGPS
jgi:hypothetical protein